jgi:hypothetical protein
MLGPHELNAVDADAGIGSRSMLGVADVESVEQMCHGHGSLISWMILVLLGVWCFPSYHG